MIRNSITGLNGSNRFYSDSIFRMVQIFRLIAGSYGRLLAELEKGKWSCGSTWGEEETTFLIEIWSDLVTESRLEKSFWWGGDEGGRGHSSDEFKRVLSIALEVGAAGSNTIKWQLLTTGRGHAQPFTNHSAAGIGRCSSGRQWQGVGKVL